MEDRVRRALGEAGVDPTLAGAAHRAAMLRRHALLGDEDDPRYLHPGRTLLVLLQDFGERDPECLAVGVILDSREARLRISSAEADEGGVPAGVLARAEQVPQPRWGAGGDPAAGGNPAPGLEDGELLEELVTGEPWAVRTALAEALDQLRHAHLWDDAGARERAAALATKVLEPVARRLGGTPSRRFAWWVRRVAPALRSGPCGPPGLGP